jgi:MFS family permease
MVDDDRTGRRGWLNRTVAGFGLTSLLSDVGHEMATSILPMHLAGIGLGSAALGAIEGIADAASGIAKLLGGMAGQRLRRKKPATSAGYAVTAICTSALGLVTTVPALVALRSAAWIGRGFRGPLRDFLVADSVEPRFYGRAFGVERAGDMVGAVVGPLAALGLLAAGLAYRSVLLVALVPGLAAAATVVFLVRERPQRTETKSKHPIRPALPAGTWPLLAAIFVFGLGDFARSFLILAVARAAPSGAFSGPIAAIGLPVVLYAVHNGVSALATFPAGRAADHRGHRPVLAVGYALGVAVNVVLALGSRSLPAVAAAFVLSGAAIAVEETVEKSCVAEMLPREVRSYGLGVLASANAVADMASSVFVGMMWDRVGGGVAFGTAAAFSAAGLLMLLAFGKASRANRASSS